MSDSVQDLAQRLDTGLNAVLVGADRTAFALLIALLGRGHALIEGVPGTGKTLLVRTLALLLGLPFRRIQFTPDLMPADVVGTTVFNPQNAQFSTRPGPIFANIVLADEINRTPPKTQSALLEAMEEGRVTIDGVGLELPVPFLLCATQNPIEYEGTYPLPEAQLDRFLVKVYAQYPQADEELTLLGRAAAGFDAQALEASGVTPVTGAEEILRAQRAVRAIHVSAVMQRYVYDIIAATRASQQLALGASPRAALGLMLASQAAAAIDGREFSTPDDVKHVAQLVLAHRLIVHAHAEIEGMSAREVLDDILAAVPVPRE
jgi:MoxR-like ATPase